MKFDKLTEVYLKVLTENNHYTPAQDEQSTIHYVLRNKQTGEEFKVGEWMEDPVEGLEGQLVHLDPEEDSYSFYADGEGFTHPLEDIKNDWEIVKSKPYFWSGDVEDEDGDWDEDAEEKSVTLQGIIKFKTYAPGSKSESVRPFLYTTEVAYGEKVPINLIHINDDPFSNSTLKTWNNKSVIVQGYWEGKNNFTVTQITPAKREDIRMK